MPKAELDLEYAGKTGFKPSYILIYSVSIAKYQLLIEGKM
jgi:hypothetical protein